MQSSGLSCLVFYPKTHLLLKKHLKCSNMYVGRTLFLVGENFFRPCMQTFGKGAHCYKNLEHEKSEYVL